MVVDCANKHSKCGLNADYYYVENGTCPSYVYKLVHNHVHMHKISNIPFDPP